MMGIPKNLSDANEDDLEAQVLAADRDNRAEPVTPQFWSSLREFAVRTAVLREFEEHEPC